MQLLQSENFVVRKNVLVMDELLVLHMFSKESRVV